MTFIHSKSHSSTLSSSYWVFSRTMVDLKGQWFQVKLVRQHSQRYHSAATFKCYHSASAYLGERFASNAKFLATSGCSMKSLSCGGRGTMSTGWHHLWNLVLPIRSSISWNKQMNFNPLERCDSALIVINCLIWNFHVTDLLTNQKNKWFSIRLSAVIAL